MIVERTYDTALIKAVITMPNVWESMAEDELDPYDYQPSLNDTWLVFADEDELIGLVRLEQRNTCTYQFHFIVIPALRKRYSLLMVKAFFKWLLDNKPDLMKLNVVIPENYKHIRYFASACGFQREGINRQSFIKHGKINNQLYFGITRQEIEERI